MNRRVLVIEDSPTDQLIMRAYLEKMKIHSDVVDSWSSALSLLTDETYDLFLVDLQLGEDSGIDIVKRLKKSGKHQTTPVIIVSSLRQSDDVLAGIQAGAKDYVVKPLDKLIFESKVRMQLRLPTEDKEEWYEYPVNSQTPVEGHWRVPVFLKSLSEVSLTIVIPRGFLMEGAVDIQIPMFSELGIKKSNYRVVSSQPHGNFVEVKLQFVGLDESDRKKIRIWCRQMMTGKTATAGGVA